MADKDELDKRLQERLQEELDGLVIPPPDPAAKRRAIAMARGEFVAAKGEQAAISEKPGKTFQGLFSWLRLIIGNQTDEENAVMPFNQKLIATGVAAACVGVIAVGISLRNPTTGPGLPPTIPAMDDKEELSAELRDRDAAGNQPVVAELNAEPLRQSASRPAESRADASQKDKLAKRLAEGDMAGAGSVVADEAVADYAAPPPQARRAQTLTVAGERELSHIAPDVVPIPGYQEVGRDRFEEFEQNPVKLVSEEPVSTFSADVDTASYSFVRRMLNQGVLPQSDAVRAEEMINYFDYDYPLPESREQPFRPTVTVINSPWAEGRQLLHIGIKGYDIAPAEKPRSNLVFLLDVSGSMNSPDKLPLVKQSMELLLSTLNPDDTVAIAVYAGAAGTVLEPTPVKEKQKIIDAMRQLSAGGSTAGAQGIRLAYELAERQFEKGAINRVILATDGDFNVGITNDRELKSFIERKRDAGIFLSVLGFGQGNYQDAMMQNLAQNGNGVAAYIDSLSEAQKVLVDEATSTLFTIAKDVKLQVEFNPAVVAEYRLIGYETRHLNREDFNNDAVDAGDIGAGHSVTAIYEFTPVGSEARQIDASRYARQPQVTGRGNEYAFLKIRYKLPDEDSSKLITRPVTAADIIEFDSAGPGAESGFATAVAGFAQLLKGGRYTGDYSYDEVIKLAQQTKGADPYGYRTEFIQLVRKAKTAAAMQVR